MRLRKRWMPWGDGVAIGTGINAVRHVQSSRLLMVLTVLLLLIGLAAETCMAVIPELTLRGLHIYLTGAVLLVVMALKGYPLLIRYQKRLLILAAAIFAAEAIFLSMIEFDWISDVIWDTAYIIPWHMIDYYALLLTDRLLSSFSTGCGNRHRKPWQPLFFSLPGQSLSITLHTKALRWPRQLLSSSP